MRPITMARLRILPFVPAPETESPMVAFYAIGGHCYEASVWTPGAWALLTEADRPDDALPIGGGYWHRLRHFKDVPNSMTSFSSP